MKQVGQSSQQLNLIWKPFKGDISARKHKGNPNSQDAFQKARVTRAERQKQVLDALRFNGPQTVREIQTTIQGLFNKEIVLHSLSGRISELKAEGYIYATGARRDGCGVVALVPQEAA